MRLILRGVYLLFHLSLLGVFAAALAARYVHPQTAWWLQPIAVVLPVLALFVLGATILSMAMGRWILFALSLVSLLLYVWRYTDLLRGIGGVDAAETMTVASLNTQGGVNNLEGGDRGIPALVQAVEPDVLCLQEFPVGYRGHEPHTYGEVDDLFEIEGYEIIAPDRLDDHRNPPPIVTRVAFEQSSVHGLPAAGTIVRAQLAWKGRSFVVFNVHLQGYTRRRPWEDGRSFSPRAWLEFLRRSSSAFVQRAAEARAIREMLEREELPFLLCGDFNTTPHQWVYGELSRGMKDAFLSSGRIWGPTFPSSRPLVRIDYILASAEWKVVSAYAGPDLPPDHRPVVAKLAF